MRWPLLLMLVFVPTISMAVDDFVVAGKLRDSDTRHIMADATIHLVAVAGIDDESQIVASTKTDENGYFRFEDLAWPIEVQRDALQYYVIADVPGRPLWPIRVFAHYEAQTMRVGAHKEQERVQGRVLDPQGNPVAGALIRQGSKNYPTLMGLTATVSDKDGRFTIDRIPIYEHKGKRKGWSLYIAETRYLEKQFTVKIGQPNDLVLSNGCILLGSVNDADGKPVAGIDVFANPLGTSLGRRHVKTDASGQYQLIVQQGNYHVQINDRDLAGAAIANIQCRNGTSQKLDPIVVTPGGWLTGRIVHPTTGEPVYWSKQDIRITVGAIGPSHPNRNVIDSQCVAQVEDDGRFRVRVSPGDYYPYMTNEQGSRMYWDTLDQEPVKVVEGSIVRCIMKLKLPKDPAIIIAAAKKVRDGLPKEQTARVQAIIAEFRKLNHTVDGTDLWCLLMKDLIKIGPDAVPVLCKELEQTQRSAMMRRLAFALRAIGDPRAVPTMIRVIPKMLQPSMSDFGLNVHDLELAKLMRAHQIKPNQGGGKRFSLGRPIRELFSALQRITKQRFKEEDLYSMSRRKDPHSRYLQEQMFYACAQRWQRYWQANHDDFGVGPQYASIKLAPPVDPITTSSAAQTTTSTKLVPLPAGSEIDAGGTGWVLTPVSITDARRYFLDLDTGYTPRWPIQWKHDETTDIAQVEMWAASKGVDLICIRPLVGQRQTLGPFVLRGVGMKLWEIDPFDAKNMQRHLEDGTLPDRKPIGKWVVHHDAKGQAAFRRGAAFLYQTREGVMGTITITDFVAKKQNNNKPNNKPVAAELSSTSGLGTLGVGFNTGVQFRFQTFVR